MNSRTAPVSTAATAAAGQTVMNVLLALSVSHLLNDTIQAVIPAIYPVLKDSFQLSYTQIGLITFVFQITGSLLQPFVGLYTDKHPQPYSLAAGMGVTLAGIVLLSQAWSYAVLIFAAALVGAGSAIFHPEASRVARMASGGRHGFAQSLFQVGGNFGSSLGPVAALIVASRGQSSLLWFSALAVMGIAVLSRVGGWYRAKLEHYQAATKTHAATLPRYSRKHVLLAVAILVALIFSKYFYLVSLSNYYTFYLIERFGVSVQTAQVCLFVFLFAVRPARSLAVR